MRFARLVGTDGQAGLGWLQEDGTYLDVTRSLRAFRNAMGRDFVPAPLPETPLDAARMADRLRELLPAAAAMLRRQGEYDSYVYPASTRCGAPLPRPTRILAIGRNYGEHAREQGKDVFEEPIVFLKASTSVIGPGDSIVVPSWVGRVDHEAELLVVLGTGGKDVRVEDAMALVAGYTIFNDVTARTQQRADQERHHPWFRSKSMDTFGPMGPLLVTADEIPDPHALAVSCTVNGERRQKDTTGSMIYRIPALIAFLSHWFRLEPGDVIATGTPAGIGPIAPGDVVECAIENIGRLSNPVVGA